MARARSTSTDARSSRAPCSPCNAAAPRCSPSRASSRRRAARPAGRLHEEHGLQCGYCTPGMITRAYRLLKENPDPPRRRSATGCRATSAAAPATRTSSRRCSTPAKKLARKPPAPPRPRTGGTDMAETNARARNEAAGDGRLAAAQGGRALHPRPRHLRRRHQAARNALRRDRAQPLRPRAHQVDRQDRRRWRCRAWSRC